MSYEYNPKSNVVFGNVDLSDYNAYAVYCNIFDRPERDVSVVAVPGRNGDLIFDNGRYKNVDRTYQIQVVGVENVHNLIRDLTSTIGYQRLEDEYDPNVYMMARLKSKPNVRKFVGNAVLLTVTFDRMPQRWDKNESVGTSEKILYRFHYQDGSRIHDGRAVYAHVINNTNESTKPIIKLNSTIRSIGSTDVWFRFQIFIKDTRSITYNDNYTIDQDGNNVYETDFYEIGNTRHTPKEDIHMMDLRFYNKDGYTDVKSYHIVIDSENKIVYDDDTKENLNDCIENFKKFPVLNPGNNYMYIMDYFNVTGALYTYDINARKWSL